MQQQGLALADYAVVAGFFLVMVAIGVYFSGRMKNLRDFFGGGSAVPWWISGISLYMTTFSAFAFVAYSALAYQYGFVAVFIWWSGVPGWIISARYFAARWRRAASTSPVEFIETRYGRVLRQGFAWEGVPLIVIDDALKLFVIGTMVSVSLGVDDKSTLMLIIAACGTIMLSYTFLGGLWAVMITDFIQFFVMAAAVLILIPLVFVRLGGIGTLIEHVPEGFWDLTSEKYTWFWIGAFFVIQVLNYATKWPLVQRYYAVRADSEARKVGYLVAALTIIGPPLLFFPAMAARVFMPGVEDGNTVYPLLCGQLLPVGMVGLMIAAMFSATMSMLSSDYNSVASVITNDMFKRLFARNASDRALVLVGRAATLLVGVVAMGIALLLANAEGENDLVDIMAKLFGVLVPPIAIPMMLGLVTRKVSNAGGLGGFLAGALSGIAVYAMSYTGDLEFLRDVRYLTWITSIPTLSVMGLLSFLLPDNPEKREQVRRFLDGLDTKNVERLPLEPSANKTADALAVIGLAVMAMGAVLLAAVAITAPLHEARLSIAVGAIMIIVGFIVAGFARTHKQGVSTPCLKSGNAEHLDGWTKEATLFGKKGK